MRSFSSYGMATCRKETRFVILRTKLDPWRSFALAVLFISFPDPLLHSPEQEGEDNPGAHDRSHHDDSGRDVDGKLPSRRAVPVAGKGRHSLRRDGGSYICGVFRPRVALRHAFFVACPHRSRLGSAVSQISRGRRRHVKAVMAADVRMCA